MGAELKAHTQIMSSNHVHRSFDPAVLGNHAHHLTQTQAPYDHVQIQSVDKEIHTIPASQALQFHCMRKQTFVSPDTAVQANTLSGASSNYTEWELPSSTQICERLFLEWQTTWTSSASGENVAAKSSWHQIDRIEIYGSGSQITATVRGQDAHLLMLDSFTDEEYRVQANAYNMSDSARNTVFPYTASTGASQTRTRVHRVQLKSLFDNTRLFICGLDSPIRIRVYWEELGYTSLTGSPTLNFDSTRLIIDEVLLQANDYNRLMRLYKSGSVTKRFIDYHHSQNNYAVSAGQEISVTLSSHQNLSAGLLIYFRSQNLAANTTYHAIDSLELTDDRGERVTEKLTHSQLQEMVYPACGLPGDAVRLANTTHYFIPFCVSLAAAINGPSSVSGSYYLNSRDKVQFTASTALAAVNSGNIVANVVSLAFATIRIKNGQLRVFSS
jgi:hypothetical protein